MMSELEEARTWLLQAVKSLLAADVLLREELPLDAISRAYFAMVYTVRAALASLEESSSGALDILDAFKTRIADSLEISKENRRVLVIVHDLRRRSEDSLEWQVDGETAAVCVEDAKSFVNELAEKVNSRLEA